MLCVNLFIYLFIFAVPCSLWDLSSPTRNQTLDPALEIWSLSHWITRVGPVSIYFCCRLGRERWKHSFPHLHRADVLLSRAHLKYHLPKDSFRNLLRSHSTYGPSHELVTHLLSLYPISVTSIITSVQLLSRVRLCDPMHCSLTGFPVHHQLPELAQTQVYQVIWKIVI